MSDLLRHAASTQFPAGRPSVAAARPVKGTFQKLFGGIDDRCICLRHPLRPAGGHLWRLCRQAGDVGGCRHRAHAGNLCGGSRGRESLPQPAIHHHRHRRRRRGHRPGHDPGFEDRGRLPDRRHPVRRDRLHRHERVGAGQHPRRPGLHRQLGRRPGPRLQVGRHHRSAGGWPRSLGRDRLLRRAAQCRGRNPRHSGRFGRPQLRRFADLHLRPSRRRHLHQGCGRRRGPRGQGRSRHPRG